MIERNTTKEPVRPKQWTIDDMKRSLLEASRGRLLLSCEYPDFILLNKEWRDIFEDLFKTEQVEQETTHILERIRNVFQHNPFREQGLTVVTNSEGNAVFIPTRKVVGNITRVSFENTSAKYLKNLLGILHTHPLGGLFSSEDILSLMTGSVFFAGVVTPTKYYLAFRTKDTKSLGPNNSMNRGYLLAMARARRVLTSTLFSDGIECFGVTRNMFSELNMPLYVGNRRQLELKRIR